MSVIGSNVLAGASGQAVGAYEIERSLRFNSSDSAYLSKNFGSAGNRKTWTWAGWVKRVKLGAREGIFSSFTDNNARTYFEFGTNADTLRFLDPSASNFALVTTAVFRDPSAWMNVVLKVDTTQATEADRVVIYVNGAEQDLTGTYPGQNDELDLNQANAHYIGSNYYGSAVSQLSNNYLADVHFIDGQALTPSSFTEVDATTGQLVPIAYSGTYGTNGFHLPFSDNSTAAALGTDTSGAGNTWTVNNISVAAGSGNDSLVDTPTNYGTDDYLGGSVRGNYCTWNPLCRSSSYATFSNGNLDLQITTADHGYSGTLFVPNSGKWYFEVTMIATTSTGPYIGIVSAKAEATDMYDASVASGLEYGGPVFAYLPGFSTNLLTQTTSTSWSGVGASTPANGDVYGVAIDFDNGAIYFSKNGTFLDSGDPTSGSSKTGAAFTSIAEGSYSPVIHANGTGITVALNAGQRPFAYTAPSGFKALCTTNLPDPQTITTSGSYTGNGVADGPFVYLNGVPTAMTVNGNAVTFGTEADKLSNGFKIRTTSTTYNQNASTYNYSITSTGDPFKIARAQANP